MSRQLIFTYIPGFIWAALISLAVPDLPWSRWFMLVIGGYLLNVIGYVEARTAKND